MCLLNLYIEYNSFIDVVGYFCEIGMYCVKAGNSTVWAVIPNLDTKRAVLCD